MNKILTDQARMCFEIAQWILNGKPENFKYGNLTDKKFVEGCVIKALTHVPDEEFREEFEGFPYEKLEDWSIFGISKELENFIQNINADIVTLKEIFNSIEGREEIVKSLGIKYTVNDNSNKSDIVNLNLLLKYGYDLVQQAEEKLLDPVIGREDEVGRVVHVLSRKVKNNPLLIGEPGVGKTAIVEAVAQHIANKNAGSLNEKRIISLDLNSIVAGTKFRGDFENRMQEIISILKQNPDIVLFVDEIHNLVGHSGQEFGNIFKPYLSRGEIQVIGATTNKEYRDIFQKEKALDRRFQSITVREPTSKESLEILKSISNTYENWHNVKLSSGICEEIISLAERYMTYRRFPDKAIDILDELCSFYKSKIEQPKHIIDQENVIEKIRKDMSKVSYVDQYEYYLKIQTAQKKLKNITINYHKERNLKKTLVIDDLYNIFYKVTGVPVGNIKIKEKEILLGLENKMNSKIIGQKEAISNISKSVVRSKLGYTRKNKPIASFLFVGPSGTGKTLSSQVLSDILFPNQKSYQRFDMSEYVESHSISKLIGSPPGYVGFGSGGLLTNFGKENPYSIILFDEIEKANKTIENLMLQLLDNGTVTDTNDDIVNFNNAIIIFTSNCIVELKEQNTLGFNVDNKSKEDTKHNKLFNALTASFRKEFLNRIDYIVMFNKLNDDNLKNIIDLEIEKLSNEFLTSLNIKISSKVKDYLMDRLERKNARYITKTIQNEIIDPLIEKSLKSEVDLTEQVSVSISNNKVKFKQNGKKKI